MALVDSLEGIMKCNFIEKNGVSEDGYPSASCLLSGCYAGSRHKGKNFGRPKLPKHAPLATCLGEEYNYENPNSLNIRTIPI